MLARDRVGKKPLFYRATASTLWFASEPRAILLDPEVPRELDTVALDSYLRFQYVPHPRSAFAGIRKLPPGHVLVWEGGAPEISRYWSLSYADQDDVTMAEAGEIVRQELLEATRFGCAPTCRSARSCPAAWTRAPSSRRWRGRPPAGVRTFSIGFDVTRFDETAYARQVAERYDTELTSSGSPPDAIIPCRASSGTTASRSPIPRPSPASIWPQLTRRHVTVALNGDGGDESFAGYNRYLAQIRSERLQVLPSPLRRMLAATRTVASVKAAGRARSAAGRSARSARSITPLAARTTRGCPTSPAPTSTGSTRRTSLAGLPSPTPADRVIADPWQCSDATGVIGTMLDVDVQTYLPGDLLVKMDIATMAHSLEVSAPTSSGCLG